MKSAKNLRLLLITAYISFVLVIPIFAQEKIVEDLEIIGYKTVSREKILEKVKTRPGEVYKEEQVKEDFQRVMEMGIFDKLRCKLVIQEGPRDGKIVKFVLKDLAKER